MSSRLREVAQEIRSWADYIYSYPNNIGGVQQCARDIMETIDKIASEPLRNCDVGTPQEQIKRWEEFCLEHHEYWKPGKSLTAIQRCNCPCYEGNRCNYFIWAQMPYEEVK